MQKKRKKIMKSKFYNLKDGKKEQKNTEKDKELNKKNNKMKMIFSLKKKLIKEMNLLM